MKGNLNSLTELTSNGKSGSFFYYTADARFTLKTIRRCEFLFLKRTLRSYYEHVIENQKTLIIKYAYFL